MAILQISGLPSRCIRILKLRSIIKDFDKEIKKEGRPGRRNVLKVSRNMVAVGYNDIKFDWMLAQLIQDPEPLTEVELEVYEEEMAKVRVSQLDA